MTTTVFCKLLQKDLPKLSAPPFPGEKGQEIFEQFLWDFWRFSSNLTEQRDRFLSGDAADEADGFVEIESDQP